MATRADISERLRRRAPTLYPEPLRRWTRRAGYDVVRADFNSPIPDLDSLPATLWSQPAPMPGVDLRISESLALLQDELAPYIREYSPPDARPGTTHGYYRHNAMYPTVDGEITYALMRHLKPRRVVEIGAGFSSLVISDALARNAAEGSETARRVFDPFPSAAAARAGITIEPVDGQRVPAAVFGELGDGDILMIDTTHTVKPAGEVVYFMHEVLPVLPAGVVIHIHDFFRPYEYPKWMMEQFALYWQEHHLVQSFLAFNSAFEVLIANYALTRQHPKEVGAIIRGADGYPGDAPGSALWLRRTR